MNIENGLLWAASRSAEIVERLQLFDIKEGDFDEPNSKRAFRFIVDHVEKHEEVPTVEAVEDITQCEIVDPGVASEYVLSEFVKRKLFRQVGKAVKGFEGSLRSNDPQGALEKIREFITGDVSLSSTATPTSMFDLGDVVDESYKKVKSGYVGIEFPWETLTDMTMGMWPGTATYFVARPGVGKTHVAMLVAKNAWAEGKRVLIVSPEMSKGELAERFFVLQAGVSATNVMRGTLPDFEYTKLKSTIDDLRGESGIWIIDSGDDLGPGGMETAIRMVKPDLVAIDSIYMLRFQGNKTDRTMAAVDWIRRAAKKYQVPIICFHQLSRQATKDKKLGGGYDESAIALTDQLLWDAQAVFIMEQDKDMKADKRMKIHVGKLRRGSHDGVPVELNWDFESMKFDEIKNDAKAAYKDEEYDVPF